MVMVWLDLIRWNVKIELLNNSQKIKIVQAKVSKEFANWDGLLLNFHPLLF